MQSSVADLSRVRLEWAAKIPMRDGATLSATIYHPSGESAPRPTLLTMTPYIADRYHETGVFFASHGYTFIIVDVRGRGNSLGEFDPYSISDAQDGYDVLKWISRQSWWSGRTGMWGGSYAGYNQWSTLKEFPPGLATIVPVASGHPGVDQPPSYKNIVSLWSANWAASVAGRAANDRLAEDYVYWAQVARSHFLAQRPLIDLEQTIGRQLPGWSRWLAHPALDESYEALTPDPAAYAEIDIPVLTITGQFDGVQRGALRYYDLHMQYGSAAAHAGHFLVIGPWNHAGTRKPALEVGGLKVGEASLIDMDRLLLEWYDWILRRGAQPSFLRDRVAYYVTGSEEWHYASSLDQLPVEAERLYLGGNSTGNVGSLLERAGAAAVRSYDYDPRDTRPGENESLYGPNYLRDDSPVRNLYGAGLVYETEPLGTDRTYAGRAKAVLWLDTNVPDSDIEILLYEVAPDGSSLRLSQDQMRLRYRNSVRKAEPMPEGRIVRCELCDFAFFARRISRGSRLRLLIHAPNSIFTEKNYNSGGEVCRESGTVARVARVNLHQGGNRASYLELQLMG